MLKGIDISNHQEGFSVLRAQPEFVIVKATEGISFIDRLCDGFISQAKQLDIPFGFYHFARTYDPKDEAKFFYKQTEKYVGEGIPALDIEITSISNNWIEEWCKEYYRLSNVYPWIYINADFINNRGYGTDWVREHCPLWLAGYPRDYLVYPSDPTCPYRHSNWNLVCWQFTGSLQMDGMDIDGDFFYGSRDDWQKYTGGKHIISDPASSSLLDLASDVIRGRYGNGKERMDRLGDRYSEVQAKVNDLWKKAMNVIKGDYGNGRDRMEALGPEYWIVQYIVNGLMRG